MARHANLEAAGRQDPAAEPLAVGLADVSDDVEYATPPAGGVPGRGAGRRGAGGPDGRSTGRRVVSQVAGVLAEIFLTLAAICALYVVWQTWWTGVQAEHTQAQQRQAASWTSPASDGTKVAPAQQGDPPVQPTDPKYGDLIAQLYVPRFGEGWARNIVEGTDAAQLARHGLGHYENSQLPGQVGNFAIAGHRSGYGEPLIDVDKLQPGDPIVIRTQDYWYVYTYQRYQVVDPTDVWVVAPNPEQPGSTPTKRMITLTTCDPPYQVATHRWISWGELKYWAKVADGVPQELATQDASGAVRFTGAKAESPIAAAVGGSLAPVVAVALLAWLVLAVAAAVAWRWPALRAIREGRRPRPDVSFYGWLTRLMPGVLPVRLLLVALLLFAAAAALLEWVFPWAASTIPFLKAMSNYVAVS